MERDVFEYLNELIEKRDEARKSYEACSKIISGGYFPEGSWALDGKDDAKKEYDKYDKQVKNYYNLIEMYSTFEPDVIGKVIAKLISEMENEDYEYKMQNICLTEPVMTRYGEDDEITYYFTHIISKCGQNHHILPSQSFGNPKDQIKKLLSKSYLLGYESDKVSKEYKIKFYDSDLVKQVDFDDKEYVYDFINYVINYRIHNGIAVIDDDILNRLLNNFLQMKKGSTMIKRRNADGKKD